MKVLDQLSLEPAFLAVSFSGLAHTNFCLSGRLSSEPSDFAAVCCSPPPSVG